MSFEPSREQRAFAAAVTQVVQRFENAAATSSDDDARREALWRELRQRLALPGIVGPEQYGGAGGTFRDVSVALERLAEHAAVGALPAVFAGLAALHRCAEDDAGRDGPAGEAARAVAAGACVVIPSWLYSDRTWTPDDAGRLVPAGCSDRRRFLGPDDGPVLLTAPTVSGVRALLPVRSAHGDELWLSEPLADGPAGRLQSVDPGTAVLALGDGAVAARPVHRGDLRSIQDRATATADALSAVEAVGSASRLLTRTVEYLKIRTQFGQVLASFQGLQFMAADLYRSIEPVRSLAYAAVDALDGADPEAAVELATAAKFAADELHPHAALEAIQMHGGIGFSWELGLHRHFKRAVVDRAVGGDDEARRRMLAARIRTRSTTLSHHDRPVGGAPSGPPRVSHASTRPDGAPRCDDDLRREVRDWIGRHRAQAPRVLAALEPMMYEHSAAEQRWTDLLRDGRWLCLSWPERYGGRGLSALQCIAVNEEFAAAGVPRLSLGIGESLLAPALLAHGTEQQRARLLPRILSGEDVYCQGFSEPEHGSDLAHLQTRGDVTAAGVVVNGTKIWQSAAHLANRIFLLCRTDPASAAHSGLTYCIADMHDNGVTVEPIRMMPGFYGYNQTTFENTRVAHEDVIGGVGNGWQVAMTTLGSERAGEITTQYLGHLRELDHLIGELDACGRLDAAQLDLVPLWLEVLKMKMNGLRVVEQLRTHGAADGLLGIDKINWSEYHVRFGLEATRLLGLRGLVRQADPAAELPHLQRVLLEAPGRRISRGTNQIQRRIIAQRILGMPR